MFMIQLVIKYLALPCKHICILRNNIHVETVHRGSITWGIIIDETHGNHLNSNENKGTSGISNQKKKTCTIQNNIETENQP